jgi:hypothetical protein
MRVDLQKVDAEITALRSKLAAIKDNLDECRRGYFEHPWAWSQMRRTLTFERHLCSVALRNWPSFAGVPVRDRWSPPIRRRSALSPAQVSGTSILIGSRSN